MNVEGFRTGDSEMQGHLRIRGVLDAKLLGMRGSRKVWQSRNLMLLGTARQYQNAVSVVQE